MTACDPLPSDKILKFYVRFSRSTHSELPSAWDLWLNVGGARFENYGDAKTKERAENMARRIARRSRRQIEFVNPGW